MVDPTLLQWLVPVATVAAAWGGTRQALNGTRERVRGIDDKLDRFIVKEFDRHTDTLERVARVETKVNSLRCYTCDPGEM